MSRDSNPMLAYLSKNPRMMGVLFTLVLLLSQAGGVAARNTGVIYGP